MAGITLGKFEVGQRVRRIKGQQSGTVIDVKPSRIASVRVSFLNRTSWHRPAELVQIIATEPPPAVGPGGWLLDTEAADQQ